MQFSPKWYDNFTCSNEQYTLLYQKSKCSRCFPLIMHLSLWLTCIFWIPYPVPHFQYSRHYLNPTPFKNSVLITHCMYVLVTQSCPALCDPMDYGPPGSSVHEDSPGKNTGVRCHAPTPLPPHPGGYSQPRDWTQASCIASGFFTHWATREVQWLSA